MGADKALLDLGGRTAIERVVAACRDGGLTSIVIVRAEDAAPLPANVTADHSIVSVSVGEEMLHSVRTGLGAVASSAGVLVFPVDYAMVKATTVRAVVADLVAGGEVVLPLFADRPGHPIGLARGVFPEVKNADTTLREVVVADDRRVRVVEVDDPWIRRDLDTPEDLAAARAEL